MPMQAREIEDLLRETFPNAKITVEGNDGVHMAAMIIDESFRGQNRVQQQRAVYAALKGRMERRTARAGADDQSAGLIRWTRSWS